MKKKKNTALPGENIELTPEEIAAIEREREILDQSAPYHNGERLLSARGVKVNFNLRGAELTAIRGASLDVYEGETLAIVGESGSGKSVFTKTFLGMLDKNGRITDGEMWFHGEDMVKYTTEEQWLKVRGKKIAMVFQDPMTSLNPVRTIGEQIAEVIMWHFGKTHDEAKAETIELLAKVGIPDPEKRYKQYPGQFSGGMRQRVVIATAIACKPEILICDEPTTALDVTVQAQVLDLIKSLQKELKMSVVFITHDLGVVANVADWVAVMYAGKIVEYGNVHDIFKSPEHPYTKALLRSLPQLGTKGNDLYSIHGTPPSLFKKIVGDAFAPRNPDALKIDYLETPPYFEVSPTHKAKTWLLDPRYAKYKK
jgi:oligopeptide transport system ATP-binding protein